MRVEACVLERVDGGCWGCGVDWRSDAWRDWGDLDDWALADGVVAGGSLGL